VLDHIEAHLARNLTLGELARQAGLSAFHFARSFKAAVGRSPHAYLNDRRIERARTLLARSEPSLVEIALSCGYSSQSHLTRAFKLATGMTPGAYRAQFF
jgi:AraC family transcriptional regulator